jgi:cell division transport system permease protein
VRAIDYALRQGWISLWRARTATLFAVLAIALALIVLGSLLLVTWNLQQALGRLTSAAEFSVFLKDDASSEQRGGIEALLDRSGIVAAKEYISKAEARTRFASQNPDLAHLVSDLETNPFPASLEVRVRSDAEASGRADALVHDVSALPGVEDVRYDRQFLAALGGGVRTLGAVGFTLVLVMVFAAAVTVASVVRLGLQARSDEIAIMELVGAPLTFIRGPFIAEGLIQGGMGALLALIALVAGYFSARVWWGAALEQAFAGSSLEFLPVRLCLLLVAGGMAVGSAGGFVASRHAGFTSVTWR